MSKDYNDQTCHSCASTVADIYIYIHIFYIPYPPFRDKSEGNMI